MRHTKRKTMYDSKWIISAIFSVVLCILGGARGHAQQPTGPGAVNEPPAIISAHAPLTPALKARLDETHRLDQASAAALDEGQYAEAEDDARQSMSVGNDSGLAQELLASALNARGKKQEALEVYKTMADSGNDHPRNLLPYALLLLNSGQWAQAVAAYNEALPTLADGKLIRSNRQFSAAVREPKDLETAIHIALGLTYDSAFSWGGHSQADKATSEYKKAIAVDPDSALANLYYGRMLQKLGQKAQAQAAFAKAAKRGSDDVKAAANESLKGI